MGDQRKLLRLLTQNIDGLDYMLDIPSEKICDVHGSLGRVGCEGCGVEMSMEKFRTAVKSNIKDIYGTDASAPPKSQGIPCPSCGKPLIKPATVLYGRDLPEPFFEAVRSDLLQPEDDHKDLVLIVAGSSLTVSPANQVPTLV